MAETQHSASTTPEAQTERELTVLIRHDHGCWEYLGTRAQLEAEGVIPAGTKWPEGAQSLRWDAGRFRFWLRRTRPEGLKGPMRLWTSGDWWFLRCDLIGGPGYLQLRIMDKKRELAAEIYRLSPAWEREWSASYKRFKAANNDDAYRSFRALIPALNPPRRGRKPAQRQA